MAKNSKLEAYGVDTIAEADRTSRPTDIIKMLWGGNLSLSVMVFGWLTILYGLGWWQAVSAILVGTLIGSLLVAGAGLLGFRSATNNSVTSGAFFGVRGRLIASLVGLMLCMQYIALAIWTGGDTLAAVWAQLGNNELTEDSVVELSMSYVLISVAVVAAAIYGYQILVQLNKFIVPIIGVTMLLIIFALWPLFDATYAGAPDLYALVEFTPTWMLAALTAGAAGPISYVTLAGDWSRYISPERHTSKQVFNATFWGLFIGLSVPTLFGAFVSVAAFDEFSLVTGLLRETPGWLLIPVMILGFVGSLGQGGINLYSMGLDMDAILPQLSRFKSTLLVAGISLALVFLGRFVYDAEAAVTNSVLFLTSLATSWGAITLFGYWRIKGQFDKADLQVFNERRHGGRYWFTAGWNLKATFAWIAGSAAGITGISSIDYVGPIAERLSYVDVSIPVSALVAVSLYAILERKN
jgi:purine-cytosine permease-like protein